MKGAARCWSLTLHLIAWLYVYTRMQSYFELLEYKSKNNSSLNGRAGQKYDSIELLHYITIIHSITSVIITGLVYFSMRKGEFFDRRKYFFLIVVTGGITFLYFFAILYVIFHGSKSARDNSFSSIIE